MNDRNSFLIEMYNQLCTEMDRHIKVTWQIVGVLLSTFAIFALVEKNIIPLDIATAIILAVCALAISIVIESNFWYNRNLVIIANIERQFLFDTDSTDIHYYFTKHRRNNSYIDMMKIQIVFVIILSSIVLGYHLNKQVLPFLSFDNELDFNKWIPYLVLILAIVFLIRFHVKRIRDYNDFVRNSPGKTFMGTTFPANSDHTT